MRLFFIASLLLVPSAAPAQDFTRAGLTPADVTRLNERPATLLAALEEANGGAAKELASLRSVLAPKPMPVSDIRELAGAWRCRMIKVGGLLPLTPYGFFECRIAAAGDSATFAKTTGSQRTTGELIRADAATFIYRGVLTVNDDKPGAYGASAETDDVGLLYRIGPDRLRIEFPAPFHESKYNVMELVRKK